MADGESGEEIGDPTARLNSISDQFKDILMDIHSSMGGDSEGIKVEADDSDYITNTSQETEDTLANLENSPLPDIPGICETDHESENMKQEPLPTAEILPTAVINENDPSEMFSSDVAADWSDLGSIQQIPDGEGFQNGFMSFGEYGEANNEDGNDEYGDEMDFKPEVKTEPGSFINNYTGVKKKLLPGQSSFKIFVSNLATTTRNEQLEELFKGYGTVLECEIFYHKNYAFVHMETEAEGRLAIKGMNGMMLDGSTISVQISKQRASAPIEQEIGTFKLFIGGLNASLTKEVLTKMLEVYGRVVEIEIYRGTTGFAHMEEESAAREAIKELNGKLLPDAEKPLVVSEAKNPEGPKLPTIKLQVKNIGNDVTPEIIRSFFQPFGLVVKCSISNSKFDLLRKAVVHLEQLGDIRSALKELNGFEYGGNKLIVEPLFETETSPNKKERPQAHKPEPSYQPRYEEYTSYNNYDYEYESTPVLRNPPPPPRGRGARGGHMGRGGNRGRGRGGGPVNPTWQLIPMPSISEMQHYAPRGRGIRGRGVVARGLGRGRGGHPPPNQYTGGPKRRYDNTGFDTDYNFDEYYQDPVVANSRDHYAALTDEYEQYQEQVGYSAGQEYYPPSKKSRGRGGMMSSGRLANLPSLMGVRIEPDFVEEPTQVPYQPHAYPSFNLPLGEREYYRNGKKGNKKQQQAATFQKNQQQPPQQPLLAQLHQQQQKCNSPQKSQPQNYPNYLVPEQIPGSSSTNSSGFEYSTAYPSNYYAGAVDQLNAVPFDYSNLKSKKPNQQPSNAWQEEKHIFPPGVDPSEYPNLKPGSKVYINGKGKVMVRGNRGGKGKKKHPGLGSRKGLNSTPVTGVNNTPIGSSSSGAAVAGPSFSQYMNSKRQEKEKADNQEYSEWLQQKSWLYQAIPGTVRPSPN